jgi:hypothetical protein
MLSGPGGRPFGSHRQRNGVPRAGEVSLSTKEDPGCRVFKLPLLWLHLPFYCPEIWDHQSFGILDSG